MTQEFSAEALLDGAMTQDLQAREALFDYLAPRAWPMLRRMLPDVAGAKDVFREAFLRLENEGGKLRENGGSLAVWFVAVGRELALAAGRRHHPRRDARLAP
jgi:DNA-directed RNA polymerase specialized sigma24 family protein